jgi:hypothetical protein
MWRKATLFGDLDSAARIVAAGPPRDAKKLGLAATDERAAHPRQWPGLNLLGFALMQARAELS